MISLFLKASQSMYFYVVHTICDDSVVSESLSIFSASAGFYKVSCFFKIIFVEDPEFPKEVNLSQVDYWLFDYHISDIPFVSHMTS